MTSQVVLGFGLYRILIDVSRKTSMIERFGTHWTKKLKLAMLKSPSGEFS